MNEKSEQIDAGINYVLDRDQPLNWRNGELFSALSHTLGRGCVDVELDLSDGQHKVQKYVAPDRTTHYFFLAAVTFLGGDGNHPLFKKRIQLKPWFKEGYNKLSCQNARVHFMGVYHYSGNIIFVDFGPETYIKNKMNNSSAFVYTNDLYRAMKDGVAFRRDFHGHGITTISKSKLRFYVDGEGGETTTSSTGDLVEIFKQFNKDFPFSKWIKGIDAIREMAAHDWPDWRQTEWAGWFLEYKFSSFINDNGVKKVEYCKNKKKGKLLDFDLWFPYHKFYGDLKASDVCKKEAPGNDQEAFMDAINRFDRFWYVIYEHCTIKDSQSRHKFAAERTAFIMSKDGIERVPSDGKKHRELKSGVCFVRMIVLEINRFNYQNLLKTFNQGRQPDGKQRKKKFLIRKKLSPELENFQVLHYTSGKGVYLPAGLVC